jgi:DNA primase
MTTHWSNLYPQLDWEALYADLGWEAKSSEGSEDKGYCLDPWQMHKNGDTTGKLAINRDKGVYNCWVCGGGTMLSMVMGVKDMQPDEALRYCAQFVDAHHKESPDDFYARIQRMLSDPENEEKPFPHFNEKVLERWQGHHEWFDERHISPSVVEYFKLGVNEECRRYNPKYGEHVGRAAIIPHFWRDKLVGWQERWLDETPKWIGKYTNTTDFPREATLWGWDFSCNSPKPPILVESATTALMLISEGYPALATFGASVTAEQMRHMRALSRGLMLAPDNDKPGQQWRSTILSTLGRAIPLLDVPVVPHSGADLGDLAPSDISLHLRGVKVALPHS